MVLLWLDYIVAVSKGPEAFHFCHYYRVATKYEKKFPEFSRLFQSHKLTFP